MKPVMQGFEEDPQTNLPAKDEQDKQAETFAKEFALGGPVELPMESPLNLAHTFSRRADMLTNSRKYEEAMSCHRKAAEFILVAIHSSPPGTPVCVKESLSLQHKAHLSEIKRLQQKSELLQLLDKKDKMSATISRASQTDNLQGLDTSNQISLHEDEIYEILRENEDAMNKLGKHEKKGKSEESRSSLSQCESMLGAPPGMEEMMALNERLSQAVTSLLQELGSTRAEKRHMEQKLGDSQEMDRRGSDSELKFSSLNLPPLEVSYPQLAMLKLDA